MKEPHRFVVHVANEELNGISTGSDNHDHNHSNTLGRILFGFVTIFLAVIMSISKGDVYPNLSGYLFVISVFVIVLGLGLMVFMVDDVSGQWDANKSQSFEVTVFPLGIQLSMTNWQNGQKRHIPTHFVPCDQIIDCRVEEIILAHRVFSTPRLVYNNNNIISHANDDKDHNHNTTNRQPISLDLFPRVELTNAQSQEICQKLRQILCLPS